MARKPTKGYYVKGEFVAEGSVRDLELKAELKGTTDATRTDRKKASDELQTLGEALLTLAPARVRRLQLPQALTSALAECERITAFEARRRHMQYIGKLMRRLDEGQVQAIRDALDAQRASPALEQSLLNLAEQWRERLLRDDAALTHWLRALPPGVTSAESIQQFRALIRQCRKDEAAAQQAAQAALAAGQTPRAAPKGRAWRDLFQQIRHGLQAAQNAALGEAAATDGPDMDGLDAADTDGDG